ncbi:conserved protein of unknown function [Ruminococcaceae bacterium BL-4]|nr:conserved protein of unknown function [Ruminococcaceae bacterium BL-4]
MNSIKSARVFQINDLLQWSNSGENGLKVSPKYQRNQVWNEKAKSYLMDSIVKGFPIPPIFIRQTIDPQTKQTYREVIDGQQRVRAILEFVNDEFRLHKSHNAEFGGNFYSQLPDEIKEQILEYEIFVEIINEKDDAKIYDMFARLNSNNMTLNRQEIRNAKYWGEFKVFAYNYSVSVRDFFLQYNVFKEKQIARMADVEFLSTLIAVLTDGINEETQKYIDSIYKKYDQSFPEADKIESKLNFIFDIIQQIFEYGNNYMYFNHRIYFFTLFCFIDYQCFDIPQLAKAGLKKYSRYSYSNIKSNIKMLSEILSSFENLIYRSVEQNDESTELYSKFIRFYELHRTRTTSKAERIERIKFLNQFFEEM